jgi:DNA repair protein RadA/Sms
MQANARRSKNKQASFNVANVDASDVKSRLANRTKREHIGLDSSCPAIHLIASALFSRDPMAKSPLLSFVCQNCGAAYNRWQGKCESCGEWNTLAEEDATGAASVPASIRSKRRGRQFQLESLAGHSPDAPRLASGLAEFDRVTGGGFVRGSVLLLGGDPGIGKSTLLTQATSLMARAGHRVVYISGEEAVAQVRLRAARLGLADAAVQLAAETSVEDIVATLSDGKPPRLIVIDSIQTMWTDTVESAPGTVTQVRASAQALIRFAKKSGAAIILVGHVTKDGQIAGPRVVEHMVDAVMSFEGEGSQQFRILRAVKNRFGPTDEIGVFEMTGLGLREVSNPSELFLSERDLGSPGTAVFAGMEGTRPVLVELQALVVPTTLGTPRRAVVGWDSSRLSMVLAVLEAHCGVKLSGYDVYFNVAGGLRINEPAADLAAAAALVSSLANAPLPTDAVYFGEVSLSGAVRPVAQASARLKEAAKLGFGRAILPEAARGGETGGDAGLALNAVGGLSSLVADIAALGTQRPGRDNGKTTALDKNDTPARFRRQEG